MSNDNRFSALRGLDGNTDFNALRGGKPARSPRAVMAGAFCRAAAEADRADSFASVLRADAPRLPTGRTFGYVPRTAPRATPRV